MSEDGSQRSEGRCQRSEAGSLRSVICGTSICKSVNHSNVESVGIVFLVSMVYLVYLVGSV